LFCINKKIRSILANIVPVSSWFGQTAAAHVLCPVFCFFLLGLAGSSVAADVDTDLDGDVDLDKDVDAAMEEVIVGTNVDAELEGDIDGAIDVNVDADLDLTLMTGNR
jgi:hypothetical protein